MMNLKSILGWQQFLGGFIFAALALGLWYQNTIVLTDKNLQAELRRASILQQNVLSSAILDELSLAKQITQREDLQLALKYYLNPSLAVAQDNRYFSLDNILPLIHREISSDYSLFLFHRNQSLLKQSVSIESLPNDRIRQVLLKAKQQVHMDWIWWEGQPFFIVGQPLMVEDQILGILVVLKKIDLEALARISFVNETNNVSFLLSKVDSDGQAKVLLSRQNEPVSYMVLNADDKAHPAYESLNRQEIVTSHHPYYLDQSIMVATRFIPVVNWGVVLYQPQPDFYHIIKSQWLLPFVLLLWAAVVFVLSAWTKHLILKAQNHLVGWTKQNRDVTDSADIVDQLPEEFLELFEHMESKILTLQEKQTQNQRVSKEQAVMIRPANQATSLKDIRTKSFDSTMPFIVEEAKSNVHMDSFQQHVCEQLCYFIEKYDLLFQRKSHDVEMSLADLIFEWSAIVDLLPAQLSQKWELRCLNDVDVAAPIHLWLPIWFYWGLALLSSVQNESNAMLRTVMDVDESKGLLLLTMEWDGKSSNTNIVPITRRGEVCTSFFEDAWLKLIESLGWSVQYLDEANVGVCWQVQAPYRKAKIKRDLSDQTRPQSVLKSLLPVIFSPTSNDEELSNMMKVSGYQNVYCSSSLNALRQRVDQRFSQGQNHGLLVLSMQSITEHHTFIECLRQHPELRKMVIVALQDSKANIEIKEDHLFDAMTRDPVLVWDFRLQSLLGLMNNVYAYREVYSQSFSIHS